MKNFFLFILVFLFTLNKSMIKKQDLHNIIKSYIEYTSKSRKINNKNEILAISYHNNLKDKGEYSVDISFFKVQLMEDIHYKNVYIFDGYKLIFPDNDCKEIEKMFVKTKYENFNQKKSMITDDFRNWYIKFNDKNEITFISPIATYKCIKTILESKKLKFSETYKDLFPSSDC